MLKPKLSQYQVVEGDCLWKIADAQYGNPTVWPEIAEINKLPDPDLILIGMTLQLKPVHADIARILPRQAQEYRAQRKVRK